jgi:glycosyltransferase involved in cell wall biosynthesis
MTALFLELGAPLIPQMFVRPRAAAPRGALVDICVIVSVLFLLPISTSHQFYGSRAATAQARRVPHLRIPVSIVVPVFNKQMFIRRAIASTVCQSLENNEILIIDDCSTDNSSTIVHEMMQTDNRIRMVRLPQNKGTHVARIKAVENAAGEYILSLDPDDVMMPFAAEDSLHCALLNDADVVEFEALQVDRRHVGLFEFLLPVSIIASDGFTVASMFSVHELNWNLWKRLIRRSVYLRGIQALPEDLRNRRVLYAEDKLQFGMLLLYTRTYYYLRQLGYIYYRDNPGNSEAGTTQSKREALKQLRFVEEELRQLWPKLSNLSYTKWTKTPASLVRRRKRRRRAPPPATTE